MHVIPVIDCLNGACVHAQQGQRTRYQPINSRLTNTSQPVDIVKAFMDVYPFKTLYIADLNAIQALENTGAPLIETIERIQHHFPHLSLWVDAGVNTVKEAQQWSTSNVQLVLGSESFASIAQYHLISEQLEASFTLSLDFLSQGYQGPTELLTQADYWPQALIIMTLANVGSESGVDLTRIKRIIQTNQRQDFYAAGGVRHLDDLLQLRSLNIKGALVATALHNKTLSTQALDALAI